MSDIDAALELYERSITKADHNWLCYRRMGEICYEKDRREDSIKHMEQALAKAKEEIDTERADDKDVTEMRLLLGQYNYEAGKFIAATSQYSEACKSHDTKQVLQAWLGLLRVHLSSEDREGSRTLLRQMRETVDKRQIINLSQNAAWDLNHQALLLSLFDAVSQDPDLLREILKILRLALASEKLLPPDNSFSDAQIPEVSSTKGYEARGILLFYTGLAAVKYSDLLNQQDALQEALQLWQQSFMQLANAESSNASSARMNVSSALASHYFGLAMQAFSKNDDIKQLENLSAIENLRAINSSSISDASAGFLGVIYSLRKDQEQVRKVLTPMVTSGLQILYDETPDNDGYGFRYIQSTLACCQDFENAAIALSLGGTTDIVSEAMHAVAEDVEKVLGGSDEGVDKQCTLELATQMCTEMIRAVQDCVRSTSDQAGRIKAAREHVDLIKSDTFLSARPGGTYDKIIAKYSPGTVQAALDIVRSSFDKQISDVEETHMPQLSFESRYCDGRSANGKPCPNRSDFKTEFYHCLYCLDRDFCPACVKRVRDNHPDLVTVCRADHKWLRIPPLGDEVYVGPRSKTVRKAVRIHETEDPSIMTITCDKEETGVLNVEEWKEMIAKKWSISLSTVRLDREELDSFGSSVRTGLRGFIRRALRTEG